jgi:hypothetical protein
MSLTSKLLSASGGGITYVDDSFSAYTRTGTGADTVVTTGIDMTKGYLLWSKGRSGATDHALYDSVRGLTLDLASNSASAQTTQTTGLKAVSTTGHTIGSLAKMNTNGATYVDWVFREASRFFDVVTYTGTGVNRTVPHSLNSEVGTLIVKRTDTAADWQVYHRSAANTEYLVLNSTAVKATGTTRWNSTTPSTTAFSVGTDVTVNANGGTYVAYLYAHDTTADSIVQCGSYNGDGNTQQIINLGWETQYTIIKKTNGAENWWINDVSRGFAVNGSSGQEPTLQANLSNAESNQVMGEPNASGFIVNNNITNQSGGTYIYIAIRRSNKPPTVGTEVYNAIARTGTGAAATVTGVGFAPDLALSLARSDSRAKAWHDRLRGSTYQLLSSSTAVENSDVQTVKSFDMSGFALGADGVGSSAVNQASVTYINYFFKRAVSFHSEICYTGSGSNKTEIHNLSKAPDLMIVKSRSSANDWNVWCTGLAGTEKLVLNSTAAKVTDATAWNSTQPTSSVISLGTAVGTNTNAATYVAYLFSNIAGIQSIGTYVGDGTTGRLIDCGFTTGSRYVCIKAITATGSFLVADSTRGIVGGNDPYLALNSSATEVTNEDWLDPSTSGFLVNQVTVSNANVNGVTYMYWSIS